MINCILIISSISDWLYAICCIREHDAKSIVLGDLDTPYSVVRLYTPNRHD